MKIKVSWEKIFDSGEFYSDIPTEELEHLGLNLENFTEGVLLFLEDNAYEILSEMKVDLIEE